MASTFKPTSGNKPTTELPKKFEKNFNATMNKHGVKNLNEVDSALNEAELSLKKKIFSLPKMEALVFSDPKLSAKYEDMAENGAEKYGYHYNETIMNILFNSYVLHSPKYLQKYKMAIPKKKKRRDASGINQLKLAGEKKMDKQNDTNETAGTGGAGGGIALNGSGQYTDKLREESFEDEINNEPDNENDSIVSSNGSKLSVSCAGKFIGEFIEDQDAYDAVNKWKTNNNYYPTTWFVSDHGNAWPVDDNGNEINETTGSASSGQYSGPAAWGSGDLMKANGKANAKTKLFVAGGTIIQENKKNYLIDPTGFEKYYNQLNENVSDGDYIKQHSDAYSVDGMNNDNKNIVKTDIQTGVLDKPNLEYVNEKAKSVAQQRLFGMAHAVQKGTLNPNKVSADVKKIAKTVSEKDVDDFASTKHENLPEKIDEGLQDTVQYVSDRKGEEPFTLNGIKWQFVNAKYPDGKMDIGVYRFGHDLVYDYLKWKEEMNINEESMIDDSQNTMALKASPTGTQGSNMGMTTGGGSMSESYNKLLEKINNELNAFSVHHNKLKKMTEDRKPSALVLKDRLGNDNAKNFKSDLKNSSISKLVDIENSLEYKDQQTDIKDPYKLGQDIENKALKTGDMKSGEALKNVGDSANNDGDEIPKRNLSKEEQEEVNKYRLGLGDLVYDNEVGKRFEDRMKSDMGDTLYQQRQEKLKFRSKAPMYNKDTQPVEDGIEKVQFNEDKSGWNEREGIQETMVTGKYFDVLGKKRIIDFNLNEAVLIKTSAPSFFEINFDGLGNTYTSKVDINETVVKSINENKFYTDGKKVFMIKNSVQKLNENEQKDKKPVINEQFNKMKHLVGYKPANYTVTTNIKKNRGF
jgi:hypothetical protein